MEKKIQLILIFCLLAAPAFCQDLIYKAKNPAFGGDTFNYQWLQGSAQAQNSIPDPKASTRNFASITNPLNNFSENLNRQLLFTLSQQLVRNQFGEDGLKPGQYTFGNLAVDISPSLDGLIIHIFDAATGQSTQVVVPFF